MTIPDVWTTLVRVLREQNLDLPETLTPATRLEDLNGDSLDVIEVAMALEETFGLHPGQIDESQCGTWQTLGDVEDLVRRLVHAPLLNAPVPAKVM